MKTKKPKTFRTPNLPPLKGGASPAKFGVKGARKKARENKNKRTQAEGRFS